MRVRSVRSFCYKLLKVVEWSLIVIAGSVSALAQSKPEDYGAFGVAATPLIAWCAAHHLITPIATFTAAGCEATKRLIGDPWVWQVVKNTLDKMQEYAFEDQNVGGRHRNRVTLFKHVGWKVCRNKESSWRFRRPWGGFLKPIARSGHVTQNASVVFRAGDDPNEAEGIAGQAWTLDAVVVVERLPDVSGICTDDELQEYARKTWVTVDWLRKEKSTARSLIGIPVKVQGNVWGVIVVDSQSETIDNQEQIIKAYEAISGILAKLLERM